MMNRRVVSFNVRFERLLKEEEEAADAEVGECRLQIASFNNNLGGNAESFRPILVLGAMGFFYWSSPGGVWQYPESE